MSDFSLPAGEFALAIRRASIATDRKATIPVLLCLKIEALDHVIKLHGTNLFLHAAVAAPAAVTTAGAVAVDQAQLLGIVSRLPPDKKVKCSTTEQHLILKCGGAKYQLALWDYSAFPTMSKPSTASPALLKAGELARILASAAVSMLLDDQRTHLSGLELSWGNRVVSAVATDSTRLSKITMGIGGTNTGKVFIPYLGALAMQKFCDSLDAETNVNVLATGAHVHCWSAYAGLACKLVSESSVDYARVLKLAADGFVQVTLNRAAFISAVGRLRAASENAAVRISWGGTDKVVMTANMVTGQGREVLTGKVTGDAEVVLSSVLLSEMLASCAADEVTMKAQDEDKPVLILDGEATLQLGLVGVIMTCRIPS